MRSFTMVSPMIWRSKRFKTLSKEAQLLFIYLLTCEHQTMAGAYRLPPEYGASDMGWPIDAFKSALEEVSASGLILFDEDSTEVMIDGWYRFHPPKGKSTIKGIENSLKRLESEELYKAGMQAFEEALLAQGEKNTLHQNEQHARLYPAQLNGMAPDKLLDRKRDMRLSQQSHPMKGH